MTPVSVDEKLERERPKNKTAKELLTNLIMQDADEKYRDRMQEFVDTDALADRLQGRNSVASEFKSLRYGWCSLRFYAMDRVEGKPLEDVVFTVQNINDEKQEQEAVIQRIEEAESINEAKVAFMDSIADDLQRPLEKLVMLNGQILSESRDESIRRYARSAYGASSRVLLLTEGLMDGFDIESGKTRPAAKPYSLRGLLTDTLHIVVPLAEENGFSVTLDVSQTLPDQLSGDSRLLREVLVNMVSGSLPATDRGRVQLALYGKAVDDRIHLLFSVRVYLDSHRVSEASGLNHRVVAALLTGMGSELKSVRSPAGHSEVYFEIEQRVLDPAPIGALTIDDAGA
jgi:signal transduction histidine kinase